MIEKTETKRTPAYAPYESFNRLLSRMKEALPLPEPIDSSFWARMRFSGSITSALKSTLIYLGLLTVDNSPTEDLEQLVKAGPEERRPVLKRVFEKAYEPVLIKLDLERATISQVRAEFKALGADGEVGQKAVSFFLAVAKDAGIQLHKHLTARQPRTSSGRKLGIKAEGGQKPQQEEKLTSEQAATSEGMKNLHPAIAGLLQALPKPGKAWSADEKRTFKTAFEALLDVVYPAAETKAT
jgi:hypothetical protein